MLSKMILSRYGLTAHCEANRKDNWQTFMKQLFPCIAALTHTEPQRSNINIDRWQTYMKQLFNLAPRWCTLSPEQAKRIDWGQTSIKSWSNIFPFYHSLKTKQAIQIVLKYTYLIGKKTDFHKTVVLWYQRFPGNWAPKQQCIVLCNSNRPSWRVVPWYSRFAAYRDTKQAIPPWNRCSAITPLNRSETQTEHALT